MKKTYPFKPLAVLIFIFDVILCVSGFQLISMSQHTWQLLQVLSGLLTIILFFYVGLVGMIAVTIALYVNYFKEERKSWILYDALLHSFFALYFVCWLSGVHSFLLIHIADLFSFMIVMVFLSVLLHGFILLRLDDVITVSFLDMHLPNGKTLKHDSSSTDSSVEEWAEQAAKTIKEIIDRLRLQFRRFKK